MSDRQPSMSEQQIAALNRLWNELLRPTGAPVAGGEGLDPALTETVRRLQALGAAPPPVSSRERVRQAVRANVQSQLTSGKETPVTQTGFFDLARPIAGPNGRVDRPATAWPRLRFPAERRKWLAAQVATALLLVVTLFAIYVAFLRPTNQPAVQPGTPIPATPATDWPQYRGNAARTGEMPGPGLAGAPTERWRVQLGGEVASAPAVSGGVVYIGDGAGTVHALDAATGAARWTFAAGAGIGSSPAVALGLVFIGNDSGTLYALDAATGAERWRVTDGPLANVSPAVADGVVYVGAQSGALLALDGATGAERWRVPLPASPSRATAVADGVVYTGCQDGTLVAVDAASGSERWRVTLEGGTVATPTIAFGSVLASTVGVEPSRVYALDPATGAERWRFETPGGEGVWAASIGAGLVLVPSDDGVLYALDPVDGAVRWRFERDSPVVASPAVVDGVVYVANTDGTFYAVDGLTGVRRGLLELEGEIRFGPAVAGGLAFLGNMNGLFYAVGGADDPNAAATVAPAAPTVAASPAAEAGVAATGATVEVLWAATGNPADPLSDRSGGIAIDPSGNIWMADTGKHRFAIFAPDGTFLEYWGSEGSGEGQFRFFAGEFDSLGDVAFGADGTIYVADSYNHRIQVFGPDRTFLRQWGGEGSGDGQFRLPADIAIDSQGNLFVGDGNPQQGGDNRIQKFAPDGTFLLKWGEPGSRDEGTFTAGAFGLTVDAQDRVIVADGGFNRLQVFDTEGRFLGTFGTFGALGYVAVDTAGNIYVPDWGNPTEVKVLAPDGTLLAVFGSQGDGPGEFMGPWGIAVGPDGTVYVGEDTWERGNRLQAYRVTLSSPS
jgi:outer membrane protein assembly factor BamB